MLFGKAGSVVPWFELLLFCLQTGFLIYKVGMVVILLSHEADVRAERAKPGQW